MYNIPRIIGIAGNYSTTMKISGEHKRLVRDPGHHSHCFILATLQDRNTLLELAESSVKLIGEVPIQVNMIGVFPAREVLLGLAFTLLKQIVSRTTRGLATLVAAQVRTKFITNEFSKPSGFMEGIR